MSGGHEWTYCTAWTWPRCSFGRGKYHVKLGEVEINPFFWVRSLTCIGCELFCCFVILLSQVCSIRHILYHHHHFTVVFFSCFEQSEVKYHIAPGTTATVDSGNDTACRAKCPAQLAPPGVQMMVKMVLCCRCFFSRPKK